MSVMRFLMINDYFLMADPPVFKVQSDYIHSRQKSQIHSTAWIFEPVYPPALQIIQLQRNYGLMATDIHGAV